MKLLILYIILQIVNVILSTIKSIATIRGPKLFAAIMNAVSYSINVLVVIYTVMDFSIWLKILITATTNFAGTYLGIYLMEKTRKDRLWEISGTVSTTSDYLAIKTYLHEYPDIKYHTLTLDDQQGYIFYIYTKTKAESKIIKDILHQYNAYTIAHEETVTL